MPSFSSQSQSQLSLSSHLTMFFLAMLSLECMTKNSQIYVLQRNFYLFYRQRAIDIIFLGNNMSYIVWVVAIYTINDKMNRKTITNFSISWHLMFSSSDKGCLQYIILQSAYNKKILYNGPAKVLLNYSYFIIIRWNKSSHFNISDILN